MAFNTAHLNVTLALQLFQVMRLGAAVLTGIVLAKSGLPTAEIGAWEQLLYIGTTLTFFWVNGLLQGIPPLYQRQDPGERKRFLFNSFLVFCGLSGFIFLLLSLGQGGVTFLLTAQAQVPHFYWFAVYLLLNLPTYTVEYYYLVQNRPWSIVGWGVLSFGGHLLALSLPVFWGWGIGTGILMLVVLSAFKWLWAAAMVFRWGEPVFDRRIVSLYVLFCIPLMLSNVVSNVMLLFDNWLVGWKYQDPALFAVYRYGAREFPLATALVSALGTSMIPLLTTDLNAGLSALKQKSVRLMHILFPLTALLLLTSRQFFPVVFSEAFIESAALFNIYLMTLPSRILSPAAIVLSKGDSKAVFQVSLIEMTVKIVLGWQLISLWGLSGLAWSVVIAFWVEKFGLGYVLWKKYRLSPRQWIPLNWYLFYLVCLVIVYGLSEWWSL